MIYSSFNDMDLVDQKIFISKLCDLVKKDVSSFLTCEILISSAISNNILKASYGIEEILSKTDSSFNIVRV